MKNLFHSLKSLKARTFTLQLIICIIISFPGSYNLFGQTHAGLIDFEQGNYVLTHNPTDNGFINNTYFDSVYGITFHCVDNLGNTYFPRYAKVGFPSTAFIADVPITPYSTVKGSGCNGNTDKHDHPVGTPIDEGCWFLTDDDGTISKNPKTLRVDYDLNIQRCTVASGVMIDVDGGGGTDYGEAFHIKAFTNGNFTTPASEIVLKSPNYTGSLPPVPVYSSASLPTGDAKSGYWEISTTNFIERIEIEYIGYPNRNVGIAFDEFSYCAPYSDIECFVEPSLQLTNPNDGSGKIQLTDLSTTSPFTTIVSRTWTVETIATDRLYYPGGKVFDYIVPVSDHYLVCVEITAINNITGECCTKRICEWFFVEVESQECSMDPGFSYSCFTDDCIFQFHGQSNNSNRNVRGWYWTFGDGGSSYDQSPIHTYTGPGTYEVCLTITGELYEQTTAEGACCTETYCKTFTFACQGVPIGPSGPDCNSGGGHEEGRVNPWPKYNSNLPEQKNVERLAEHVDKLSVIPNPSSNEADLTFMILKDGQKVTVELLSPGGRMLRQIINKVNMDAGKQTVKINVADLETGTHFLRVIVENEIKTVKMVVMH